MPLGEGVARAIERDDARSPLTTTLNNNQLDKATSGGYGGQWRGQARAVREGASSRRSTSYESSSLSSRPIIVDRTTTSDDRRPRDEGAYIIILPEGRRGPRR